MEPEETLSIILTLAFQDSTSRNYTFGGVEPQYLNNIKTKVKAINANMPTNFARTFVSNSGVSCVMISAAKIVATEEEVIYNAS